MNLNHYIGEGIMTTIRIMVIELIVIDIPIVMGFSIPTATVLVKRG
jgi:hypothetical protein